MITRIGSHISLGRWIPSFIHSLFNVSMHINVSDFSRSLQISCFVCVKRKIQNTELNHTVVYDQQAKIADVFTSAKLFKIIFINLKKGLLEIRNKVKIIFHSPEWKTHLMLDECREMSRETFISNVHSLAVKSWICFFL